MSFSKVRVLFGSEKGHENINGKIRPLATQGSVADDWYCVCIISPQSVELLRQLYVIHKANVFLNKAGFIDVVVPFPVPFGYKI